MTRVTTNGVFAHKIRIKTSEVLLAQPKALRDEALSCEGRSLRLHRAKVRASKIEALGIVNEAPIMYNCNQTWFTL